jgi:hypothetical protein
VGAHEGPVGVRFSVHGFTSAVIGHCRQVGGQIAALRRQALVSVLVSFTSVHSGSRATAGPTSALAGTVTAGGERWCAVLESV